MCIKKRVMERVICICIVLLMVFDTYAVQVSDNDGAAFITKAEFDSLKNSFQAQLNTYNANIDLKIDDAINGYISGIKTAKEEVIKPLVVNYKDIKWKNDLYSKISVREFSNYNTYTDQSMAWRVPVFGNYRIIRAGRYHLTAIDYRDTQSKSFFFWFSSRDWFPADDGWFPSGEGASSVRTTPCGPLIFMCTPNTAVPSSPILKTDEANLLRYETQMLDRAYPSIATYYGGTGGDVAYVNWRGNQAPGPDGGFLEVTKDTDDLLAFKIKFYNRNYFEQSNPPEVTYSGPYTTNVYRIKKSLSGYGEVQIGDIRFDGPPTSVFSNANLGTFNSHLFFNKWNTESQRNRELATLRVMFLGNDTNTKVNCAIRNKASYFSQWAEYDFSESEMGSILCDQASTGVSISNESLGRHGFVWIDEAGNRISSRLSLPLWPKYFLKNLINPNFTMNGNGLAIGGGLPIATRILSKGKLKVKLKYDVETDDLESTTTPSKNIYLSFKKSAYNDTVETDNYYRDDKGNSLKDKLWEPTTTDTSYEVEIPVDEGDNVWFRLGPKDRTANGLYAKITDLDVRLIIG